MGAFIVAATSTPAGGVPLWVTVLGVGLAGLVVPIFQYLTKRLEGRAGKGVADATANLTDVQALSNTIATLSTENSRLFTRLSATQTLVDDLRMLLDKEPTKDQLSAAVGKLRAQLIEAGEVPVNGPTQDKKPEPKV